MATAIGSLNGKDLVSRRAVDQTAAMTGTDIELHRDGSIAHLVLNRPEKRNALTKAMLEEIARIVPLVKRDPTIKLLILRGADPSCFSAGADIDEFQALQDDPARRNAWETVFAEAQHCLATLIKPTIALIQGPCIGAGCGLALTVDFRHCDQTARFGVTPAALGIAYRLEDTRRLIAAIGETAAKRLLFTADLIDAEEALRLGLVSAIHPAEELATAVSEVAHHIAERSQNTIQTMKRIFDLIRDGQMVEDQRSRSLFTRAFDSDDFREGFAAFKEKRKPRFPQV